MSSAVLEKPYRTEHQTQDLRQAKHMLQPFELAPVCHLPVNKTQQSEIS